MDKLKHQETLITFFEGLEDDEDFDVIDEPDLPHAELIHRVLVETGEAAGLHGNYLECSSWSYREEIPPIDKLDIGEEHTTGLRGDEHFYFISVSDPPALLEYLCRNPTIRIHLYRGAYSDQGYLQIDVELCEQGKGVHWEFVSVKLIAGFTLKPNNELITRNIQ